MKRIQAKQKRKHKKKKQKKKQKTKIATTITIEWQGKYKILTSVFHFFFSARVCATKQQQQLHRIKIKNVKLF